MFAVIPVTVRFFWVMFAVVLSAASGNNRKIGRRPIERPEMVTRILFPTELVAKVPIAELVLRVTVSPAITPTRDAEPRFSVAVVEAS